MLGHLTRCAAGLVFIDSSTVSFVALRNACGSSICLGPQALQVLSGSTAPERTDRELETSRRPSISALLTLASNGGGNGSCRVHELNSRFHDRDPGGVAELCIS